MIHLWYLVGVIFLNDREKLFKTKQHLCILEVKLYHYFKILNMKKFEKLLHFHRNVFVIFVSARKGKTMKCNKCIPHGSCQERTFCQLEKKGWILCYYLLPLTFVSKAFIDGNYQEFDIQVIKLIIKKGISLPILVKAGLHLLPKVIWFRDTVAY